MLITPHATILRAHVSSSPIPENRVRGRVRPEREPVLVAIAAFAALVVLRGAVLYDPPYWDALLGLFPQVHWQALHGLDPFRLLREQPGYVEGGACTYPFSAIPPLLALLERAEPDVRTRLPLLHLASFTCAALACAAVFRLTRRHGRGVAWLAAAAFLAQPGVQSLACQIGLEMPFVAAVACATAALAERRWAAAFAWSAAALLVKPTGVVVAAAAVALHVLRSVRARGPADADALDAGERRWALAQAALVAVFVAELAVIHAYERAPGGAGLFAGLVPLLTKRLWTVPELGLALALLAAAGAVAWIRRARGARVPDLVLASATFLLAYGALLVQWHNVLPRYFVAAYPAVLALLVAAAARFAPRAAVAPALGALALAGLLGAHGRFQPDRPGAWSAPGETEPMSANDGWLLERSMRFRDGLALDRQLARHAAEHADQGFVAPWPLQQALLEPSFGYVDARVECATAERPVAWTSAPPPSIAELRANGREPLWILTPVDFAGAASMPRPGDVVVARFGVGAQRALVVRRASFP